MIAIVDDDESFRQAAVSFIQSLGYATAAFASAEAFLHSDCGHDVDCLITDVQMPGMSRNAAAEQVESFRSFL